jgi:hypothetical protein
VAHPRASGGPWAGHAGHLDRVVIGIAGGTRLANQLGMQPTPPTTSSAETSQLELAEVVRQGHRLLALEQGWNDGNGGALERLPCAGTLQLRCDECGTARSLAFRCVGRCAERCEHGERAAHSLVRVIPRVPVRHWTLTLPSRMRARLAQSPQLPAEVARAFVRELLRWLRPRIGVPAGVPVQSGAASLVHGMGAALNSNVHMHALVLDGAYARERDGEVTFHPLLHEPTAMEVDALVHRVQERLRRLVPRGPPRDPARDRLVRASIEHRVATGPEAGRSVRRIRVIEPAAPAVREAQGVGAQRDGTRVHAMPRIGPEERDAVLRLGRYLVRPPIDRARFSVQPDGHVRYRLAVPWNDGTTHVEFAPRELAERLAAAMPGGVVHRVAYHGALAPGAAAKWRQHPVQLWLAGAEREVPAGSRKVGRNGRRKAGRRDMQCPRCGGDLRVVAVEEGADLGRGVEVATAG